MKKLLLHAALVCALLSTPAFAQTPTPQRAEIPIHARSFTRGAPRYSIPVTLGGVALDAMFDTGSSGLRVLARALPANAYTPTGETSHYGYGSGAQLEGFITRAPLTIGPLSADAPFEFVQSVGCTARSPDCPMQHMDFATYGIGGNGVAGDGYTAIIGVGLRRSDDGSFNPLPLLGAATWIVELPRTNQADGKLILNPSAADLAGFTLIQLPHQERGGTGWADNALAACITSDVSHHTICLPALLDSGAPGVRIQTTQAHPADWPPRGPAHVNFGSANSALSYAFVSNSGLGTHLETEEPRNQPERLFLGTLTYFSFDVLYDSVHGVIGLRPRG